MSKKDKETYLIAAEEIFEGMESFCCNALRKLGNARCVNNFALKFSPMIEEANPRCSWLGNGVGAWGKHWGGDGTIETNECRILALCFAAAMAETGDL